MSQRELYLVNGRSTLVGDLGEGAAQVVRRHAFILQLLRVADYDVVNRLRRDPAPDDSVALVDRAENQPTANAGRPRPSVDCGLGPVRHRHRTYLVPLANDVH